MMKIAVLAVLLMAVMAATEAAPHKITVGELQLEIKSEEGKEVRSAHKFSPADKSPASSSSSPSFYEGDTLSFSFPLSFTFPVTIPSSGDVVHPQQVFLSFSHPALPDDLVFVASPAPAAATPAPLSYSSHRQELKGVLDEGGIRQRE